MSELDMSALREEIEKQSVFCKTLLSEVGKAIVGQEHMLKSLLVGFLADGHILLEGLPGLAKTTAVKAFSEGVELDFSRIQFTPDLLPADLLGTQIYNAAKAEFEIKKGPLFSNLILADEINRAPSKVQSALLEAMQEKQVTIGETTFQLDKPFLVLATQNPIEQEGTYSLPEAQVDRFMLKISVDYPTIDEEIKILEAVSGAGFGKPNAVISPQKLIEAREWVSKIYMDDKIKRYIVNLVHATRRPSEYGLSELASLISVGASPRASIDLSKAAKANAFIEGRAFVTPEDIKAVGKSVLRHRIGLTYEAEAEEVSQDDVVKKLFDGVEVP